MPVFQGYVAIELRDLADSLWGDGIVKLHLSYHRLHGLYPSRSRRLPQASYCLGALLPGHWPQTEICHRRLFPYTYATVFITAAKIRLFPQISKDIRDLTFVESLSRLGSVGHAEPLAGGVEDFTSGSLGGGYFFQ